MGLITRVLSFIRGESFSESRVDPGGGDAFRADHFSSCGDDAQPISGDYAATVSVQRTGGQVAVGYVDIGNARKARPGEKRSYARAAGGNQVSEIWLRNDGTVMITSNSDVNINGVTISSTGVVTVPESLIVKGDEVADHNHAAGDLLDSGGRPCSGNTADL